MSGHMAYVGVKVCGCAVAAKVDDPSEADYRKEMPRFLREMIQDGLKIERHSVEWCRANLLRCQHKAAATKQGETR